MRKYGKCLSSKRKKSGVCWVHCITCVQANETAGGLHDKVFNGIAGVNTNFLKNK